jgi:hypothetical protein
MPGHAGKKMRFTASPLPCRTPGFFMYWLERAISAGRSVILWLNQTMLHAIGNVLDIAQTFHNDSNHLN